ncbi:hypothetical protein N42HA_00358 [Lactococcus lactis]|nr:hypothetical protein [Lactococcus lactis]
MKTERKVIAIVSIALGGLGLILSRYNKEEKI